MQYPLKRRLLLNETNQVQCKDNGSPKQIGVILVEELQMAVSTCNHSIESEHEHLSKVQSYKFIL